MSLNEALKTWLKPLTVHFEKGCIEVFDAGDDGWIYKVVSGFSTGSMGYVPGDYWNDEDMTTAWFSGKFPGYTVFFRCGRKRFRDEDDEEPDEE